VVQFPIWAREFSPLQSVQAGSGTNPASYAVRSGGASSPGVNLTTPFHIVLSLTL
jgi:hypothetical protein